MTEKALVVFTRLEGEKVSCSRQLDASLAWRRRYGQMCLVGHQEFESEQNRHRVSGRIVAWKFRQQGKRTCHLNTRPRAEPDLDSAKVANLA